MTAHARITKTRQLEYNDLTPLKGKTITIQGFANPKTIIKTTQYDNRLIALVKDDNPACWWVEHNPETDEWTPYVYAGWDGYDPVSLMHLKLETSLHNNTPSDFVHDEKTPLPDGTTLVNQTGYTEYGERADWSMYVNGPRRALIQPHSSSRVAEGFRVDLYENGTTQRPRVFRNIKNAASFAMSFLGTALA